MAITEEQLVRKLDQWDLEVIDGLPAGMKQILATYAQFDKRTDIDLILRAYHFADEAHLGKMRKSGDPYITHPVEVVRILAHLKLDPPSIAAGLLHDTVEDTDVTLQDIEKGFGKEVRNLVDGVTKLGRVEFPQLEDLRAEALKKLFFAMADEIRVVLIKLADRLHNMRTLEFLNPESRISIARETLDFYSPLAHRLGIHQVKGQLEDLAFQYLEPNAYKKLINKLDMTRQEREAYLNEVIVALELLLTRAGIKANVKGRVKYLHSIHEKMHEQGLEYHELTDLTAIRIISENSRDCYITLGEIHAVYKHINEKLKDYVGQPKENGYRSLHTTIIGPRVRPVEIQIRTGEMHEECEFGIAAHWRYKEKRGSISDFDIKLGWIREMLEEQDETSDARSFVDSVKLELYTDEVVIFTPKGDVISLPKGSTPVDFAYRIHTDVGHRCHGARVNSRMVPLSTPLESGQIVEILTTKRKKGPSRDWLGFVGSRYANQKIRYWFRRESEDEQISLGKELLVKEEKSMGLGNVGVANPEHLKRELTHYGLKTIDGFYAAIGRGDLNPGQVLDRIRARLKSKLKREKAVSIVEEQDTSAQVEGDASKLGVMIEGLDDVWVRFARCCRPIPGDEVVGFITKGRGITLHRDTCPQLSSPLLDDVRKVPVSWTSQSTTRFSAYIQVWALDRVGVLRDVTAITTSAGASVVGIQMHFAKNKTVRLDITVKVSNATELKRISRLIRGVDDVLDIKRVFV